MSDCKFCGMAGVDSWHTVSSCADELKRKLESVQEQLKTSLDVQLDQQREIERLKGPCTCSHDPAYAGGACGICHADALLQLDEAREVIRRLMQNAAADNPAWVKAFGLAYPVRRVDAPPPTHPCKKCGRNITGTHPKCQDCVAREDGFHDNIC